MLVQIIVVCVIIWVVVQRWHRRSMVRLSHILGTTKYMRLPFVGHSYIFLGSDEDRMNTFQKLGREAIENGGITTVWQWDRLYLMIADPIQAEFVLKNCLEKDDPLKCLRVLTGNGSVFAPVSIWRPRRKILAPTFSPKNLNQFMGIFTRQCDIMVDQLKSQAGGAAFSIWKYINSFAMDSVCALNYASSNAMNDVVESTLGVCVHAQLHTEQPLLKAFEESNQLDAARMCQPWLHSEAMYKMTTAYGRHVRCRAVIHDFVNRIIKDKRRAMKEYENSKPESDQNSKHKTFLELLIESSGGDRGYSDVELQEETLVLVLAGTDTSAVGSAFTTVMLGRHAEVQEKVYQELQGVFGDSDRPIVSEDLPQLKYLDAVIRETLRMYPSVPLIVRKVDREVTLPSGETLVKDCGLAINIWAIHRNKKYWGEDADIFRPERFLDTTLEHPAAFMPFSYGPRGCIGSQYAMMSMKTSLAALLRRYRVLPAAAGARGPLRVSFDVMMKHVDRFPVKLETRVR